MCADVTEAATQTESNESMETSVDSSVKNVTDLNWFSEKINILIGIFLVVFERLLGN